MQQSFSTFSLFSCLFFFIFLQNVKMSKTNIQNRGRSSSTKKWQRVFAKKHLKKKRKKKPPQILLFFFLLFVKAAATIAAWGAFRRRKLDETREKLRGARKKNIIKFLTQFSKKTIATKMFSSQSSAASSHLCRPPQSGVQKIKIHKKRKMKLFWLKSQ